MLKPPQISKHLCLMVERWCGFSSSDPDGLTEVINIAVRWESRMGLLSLFDPGPQQVTTVHSRVIRLLSHGNWHPHCTYLPTG